MVGGCHHTSGAIRSLNKLSGRQTSTDLELVTTKLLQLYVTLHIIIATVVIIKEDRIPDKSTVNFSGVFLPPHCSVDLLPHSSSNMKSRTYLFATVRSVSHPRSRSVLS